MRLSVVIVNWNSKEHLSACLTSLQAQSYSELEVIVVDNGSHDGSAELVTSDFPRVKLVQTGENLGFAEGCNRGLAVATGEWVAMLNNDAVAEPEWASALMREAGRVDESVGSLQSLMVYFDRPEVVNSTGIELKWNGSGADRSEGAPRSQCSQPAEIFCPTAGAAAYRRSMLDRIRLEEGVFDRTYFMYLEDLDLGWRARLAGYTARYVPDSVVRHVWHGSSHRHGSSWLFLKARSNRLRTVLKNASGRMLLASSVNMMGAGLGLLWHGRWQGPAVLGAAVRDGLRARKQVTKLARTSRRETESRWIAPR
jgi:GT2 family glycosyltransferase